MISTKWFQGKANLNDVIKIRENVFCEELALNDYLITDMYDDFAFSAVVFDDDVLAGTGRLFFKDGKYFIDNLCVIKQFRGRHLGDLLLRMLVRRAVNMGAEKTYAVVNEKCKSLFENVGFKTENVTNEKYIMVKTGDVGGGCC